MYCPNCNEEHDGKFCPECGTKLEKRAVGSDDAQGIPEELEEEPRESMPRSIESWLGLSTGDDDKDVEEQPSADDYLDFDFDTDNDIEEQPKAVVAKAEDKVREEIATTLFDVILWDVGNQLLQVVKKVKDTSDYFNTLAQNEPEQSLIKAIIDENIKAPADCIIQIR